MLAGKTETPDDIEFVAVKRLRNGGVLFELTTAGAAKWLRSRDTMKLFTAELGGATEIKARNFPVIAEYVPVTFKPEDAYGWSEVETRNNFDMDDINGGRWIKPVEKRYQGQRFAHLIINFSSPESANEAI
ncbi:hypothetical protein OBBRIDRAFT_741107, partial [Obba rivulosa]